MCHRWLEVFEEDASCLTVSFLAIPHVRHKRVPVDLFCTLCLYSVTGTLTKPHHFFVEYIPGRRARVGVERQQRS
jgi:hypothetical protein